MTARLTGRLPTHNVDGLKPAGKAADRSGPADADDSPRRRPRRRRQRADCVVELKLRAGQDTDPRREDMLLIAVLPHPRSMSSPHLRERSIKTQNIRLPAGIDLANCLCAGPTTTAGFETGRPELIGIWPLPHEGDRGCSNRAERIGCWSTRSEQSFIDSPPLWHRVWSLPETPATCRS
jgi:hypothetical protein